MKSTGVALIFPQHCVSCLNDVWSESNSVPLGCLRKQAVLRIPVDTDRCHATGHQCMLDHILQQSISLGTAVFKVGTPDVLWQKL